MRRIMIQENWDQSVQNDVITLLNRMVPAGVWDHDHQDDNGVAHLKAGIVGPQETIPVVDGQMDYPPGRISSFVSLTVRAINGMLW